VSFIKLFDHLINKFDKYRFILLNLLFQSVNYSLIKIVNLLDFSLSSFRENNSEREILLEEISRNCAIEAERKKDAMITTTTNQGGVITRSFLYRSFYILRQRRRVFLSFYLVPPSFKAGTLKTLII